MTNPYAPPTTNEAPEPALPTSRAPFFPVSVFKLTVMSIATFGLYNLYWFFANWRRVRDREPNVSPFWRTIFSFVYCYALFKRVRDFYQVPSGTLEAGVLALGFVTLSGTWRLPDPYWLISLLAFLPLLPVQAHVNRINTAVALDQDRNDHFTAANWVVIVIGSLLLVLGLLGAFLPEEFVQAE